MNIYYSLLISIISGLFTYIGIIFTYIKINNKTLNKLIVSMLSFSLMIILLISIFDILPSSIIYLYNRYNYRSLILIIIIFILVKLLIHYLNKININNSSLYKVGILSLIIMFLHNIPEGMITFLSSSKNLSIGFKMAFSIAMHNIPEGICIAMPIYYSTYKRGKSRIALLIASLSEGIGALFTYLFLYKYINELILNIIFVIVGFLMISLAIDNIYNEIFKYNENKYIKYGFIVGIGVYLLSYLFT